MGVNNGRTGGDWENQTKGVLGRTHPCPLRGWGTVLAARRDAAPVPSSEGVRGGFRAVAKAATFRDDHPAVNDRSQTSPVESISGPIERVTFHNEETGFAVLRVSVKGHRDLVTVIGSLAAVTAGEWLTAEGKWIQNREHGRQFHADRLSSVAPTTKAGIEKYLGSGMVKGIGPGYAKKLVAKFGEKIFEIIETKSAKLEEIPGIGKQRRRLIKDAWKEQKVVRDIMVFLHSHGVSTSRAVRIYKTYGEEAIESVRENPYRLAADIQGIGFASADQIAGKLGIAPESLLRAAAGLNHTLAEAMSQGHCALPEEELLTVGGRLLGVEEGILRQALDQALASEELARDEIGGEVFICLPRLKFAEEIIAARIGALADAPSNYPAIDAEKAIAWCEAKTGTALADHQKAALTQALSRRALVITGGPGVGKTTLVNSILRVLRAKDVKCLLCAPTGRAAKRLSESTGLPAKTIHRLLEFQPGKGFARKESNPLKCDLLVVDEMSMVDVPLMHQLMRALPLDGHLLLVGDVDQLPSVGPGRVLGHLIESGLIPVARLTEVFRQAAGSRIITNAHRVNCGELPETDAANSDFFFIEREDPEQALPTLLNLVKQRIPAKFGLNAIEDVQVLSPMHRGLLGVRELNVRLQETLNPARPDMPFVEKFGSRFQVGDRVIQTRNNYDKDAFNGDIGHVTQVDAEEREAFVNFDGREVNYDFGELDELSLAYAITIHKSQGSEFPAVVIPVTTQHYMMLQRNLIYTGMTRGRSLVVLIGQKKALAMAVQNNKMTKRYSGLLERLKQAARE